VAAVVRTESSCLCSGCASQRTPPEPRGFDCRGFLIQTKRLADNGALFLALQKS